MSTRRPTAVDDLVDDPQQVLLVLEAHRQRLEDAVPFDVNAFVAVDQNIVDAGILEQRLEGPQPRHFIENFRNKVVELLRVQREPLDKLGIRRKTSC